MKKLFAKVTAAISAAAMLAVPAINVNAANTIPNTKAYVDEDGLYHRIVWEDELTNGHSYLNRSDIIAGDIDGDGSITNDDVEAIEQYLQYHNLNVLIDTCAADVNGDGKIDSTDKKYIKALAKGNRPKIQNLQKFDIQPINSTSTYKLYYNENDLSFSLILVGDVNGDNKLTTADASAIIQANSAHEGFLIFGSDYIRARRAADVNNDNRTDSTDVRLIQELDAGVRTNFDEFA